MSEAILGEIRILAGNYAPVYWEICNGQLLFIADNDALYTLLGTVYGGDGVTTFALPDLRGRVPIHTGTGNGLSRRDLGQRFGVEEVTLTVAQMPMHTHSVASTSEQSSSNPGQTLTYAAGGSYGPTTGASSMAATTVTGGSQPHNNVGPSLAVNFIICIGGIFPTIS